MSHIYIEQHQLENFIKKGNTVGKIETVKECDLVDLQQLHKHNNKKNTDAHLDLELKINTPNCHNKIVSQLARQNIDLFAEKDTY